MRFGMLLIVFRMFQHSRADPTLKLYSVNAITYSSILALNSISPTSRSIYNNPQPIPPTN